MSSPVIPNFCTHFKSIIFVKNFRVRMHYGHPDVFDRIFHITRGGISKASRVINISEDIYAGHLYYGFFFELLQHLFINLQTISIFFNLHLYIYLVFTGFNSTLRQGNITHHEYIQVSLCTFVYFS